MSCHHECPVVMNVLSSQVLSIVALLLLLLQVVSVHYEVSATNKCPLLQVIGLLLLGLGVWVVSAAKHYETINSAPTSPAILAIVVGVCMLLTAFCGIIGALKDKLVLLKIVSDHHLVESCRLYVICYLNIQSCPKTNSTYTLFLGLKNYYVPILAVKSF